MDAKWKRTSIAGARLLPTCSQRSVWRSPATDEFVEIACKAIIQGAKHGKGEVGDGKIFVTNLEECIRIRTEERGGGAI